MVQITAVELYSTVLSDKDAYSFTNSVSIDCNVQSAKVTDTICNQ